MTPAGTGMSRLELRVPPLLLTLIFAGLMWVAAAASPALAAPLPVVWRALVTSLLVATGLLVSVAGVAAFRRAETSVNPLDPAGSAALVTTGVYRRTRNPMYLGFLLLLAGWAVYLGHVAAPVLLFGYAAYLTRFQILPEERALARRFGAAFSAYAREVPRWF